jgi:3-methyl-2-oxobutanoate hydroxymethyltransferase
MKPVSVNTILKYKSECKKITALTAYDYSTAKFLDECGIDIVLVGDSLAMVALGHENTLSVTVDEMLHHTKAVRRAVKRAMVIVDMPFMSYQTDEQTALFNAGRFLKESGVNAVKIEGGYPHIVKCTKNFTEAGIPVLGHLGFTPQFLQTIGGYNVQGKNYETTQKILEQAKLLEEAGAFGIVLEMVPEESAKYITENLTIPTIGIGAGKFCSGQILVIDDILGKYQDFTPKFARKYTNIAEITKNAISEFINDVQNGEFPNGDEIFHLSDEERSKLY